MSDAISGIQSGLVTRQQELMLQALRQVARNEHAIVELITQSAQSGQEAQAASNPPGLGTVIDTYA